VHIRTRLIVRLIALVAVSAVVSALATPALGAGPGHPERAAQRPAQAGAGSLTDQESSARLASVRISAADQRRMLVLYAAYRHISVADVGQVEPGAQAARAGRREWAWLTFVPSGKAPLSVTNGFQGGGASGIFSRSPGGRWTIAGLGEVPLGCDATLPASVRHRWHLAACPGAAAAPARRGLQIPAAGLGSGTDIAGDISSIAVANVGVAADPPDDPGDGLSDAYDCNPYTALEVPSAPDTYCGTDSRFGIRDKGEFWCADFTKFVWAESGVTADLSVLNGGASSFVLWGYDQGETISFGGTPQPGDAVVFFPASTKVGALRTSSPKDYPAAFHVAIDVGSSGGEPVFVDGDFGSSTNYSVQENDVSQDGTLSQWANGEGWQGGPIQWVVISPQLAVKTASGPAVYDPIADGSLDLFGVGDNSTTGANQLFEKSWISGSGWSAWDSVGTLTSIEGTPSAVYDPLTGNLEVYVDNNGALWQDSWTGSNWAGWYDLKGAITGSPDAIYDPATGNMEVYATGADGPVYQIVWNGSGWSAWNSLPISITGSPSAISNPLNGQIEVYGDASGELAAAWWQPSAGKWGSKTFTSSITGSPSAAYDPVTGNLEVYATGPQGGLWQITWNPGSGWSAWANLATKDNIVQSPSAVYDPVVNTMEVYATTDAGALFQDSFKSGAWDPDYSLAADGTLADQYGPGYGPYALYDAADGKQEVYAVTPNSTVWQDSFSTSGGWVASALGGTVVGL
jgi:hypothetical protein